MEAPTITDWIVAVAAGLTALFTLALVIIAYRTARFARGTLRASREANEQAKHDSIEQTRPYVFVEVVPGMAGMGHYDIRIHNAGRSSAQNMILDVTRWPDKLDDIAQPVQELFHTPRTLPPGCGIRSFWRLTGNSDDGSTEAGMPEDATITVTYTSNDPSAPTYEESFNVDLRKSGRWPVPTGGPDAPDSLDGKEKAFYRLGQTIARNIGELGRNR